MESFYQEPSTTVYCGHALDLKELPPESVDMCMTSPPYWGLRSYHTEPQIWDSKDGCRHEWVTETFKQHAGRGDCQSSKKYSAQEPVPDMKLDRQFCSLCGAWRGELGLEPTIELYIKHLIQIFNEVKRVLKKTGTCWVVIDDSYSMTSVRGGNKPFGNGVGANKHYEIGSTPFKRPQQPAPAKSLCLIPQRFAIAMVENGWILRNDIVWNKPNPMPESVKDRFTTSWEHLFFFTKSKTYFFEQQFTPMAYPDRVFNPDTNHHAMAELRQEGNRTTGGLHDGRTQYGNPELGRNMRDVWEICTMPSPKHDGIRNFATYPEKLCETPILAGCPSMICKKCGKAREKVYRKGFTDHNGDTVSSYEKGTAANRLALLRQAAREKGWEYTNDMGLVGYTDCGHNDFEPGVVLDPFCGSGTTLAVAKRLGRKAIGIDINPDYCKLTVKRLQEIPMAMELVA